MTRHYDLITIGVAVVDSIIRGFDPHPVSASGYRAESGTLNAGGEAVNQAVAAAKLGMKTGILCSLGNDAAGDLIAAHLEKEGVDTSLIRRDSAHSTPVATIFAHEDGTRQSITNSAHRYNFHPENMTEAFSDTRAILLGSLFRAPFDDPGIIREVLHFAKCHGILTFADTKLPNFRKLTLDDLKDSLGLIDYITPNEDEARYCTKNEDPAEMADVFLSLGVRNVLIKLGAKGLFFKNRDMAVALPALPVDAIDATGAGDNLAAGFASEILRGSSIEDALRFANACGAICTTAVGAGTALKSREQVLNFLKTRQ